MKGTSRQATLLMAAAAAGAVLAGTPALAQDSSEIIINAPIRDSLHQRGSMRGLKSQRATLSSLVRYSDLDLASPAGATTLRNRVQRASRAICRRLVEIIPDGTPDGADCVEETSASASDSVQAL